MPTGKIIVAVDLAPIKPIPDVISFQSDITTDKCRATIRSHLKTWKADTVLHDGAPNVGTAWVQDAFSQAELVLQSLRLATEFLAEGGTFVTKVFRSKDSNALLWVFKQLFEKVDETKPPASRNVSAEIFVVCRGFKAPKRIDPKFLDPRSVFAELPDPTPNNEAKVFNPEKKKRKRDGYEEGDYIQFKEASASDFIQTTDPIAILGSLNRLTFEQTTNGDIALAALDKLPETTSEIRKCCADLKVLGRKEFRSLLRWRLKAREIFGFSTKKLETPAEAEEVTEITPIDEEDQIGQELQALRDKETSRKKRERRRENERKQREIVRMQMHMMPPTEIGLEQAGPNGEDSMFTLKAVDRAGAIEKVSRGRMASIVASQARKEDPDPDPDSDEEEDQLDRELDSMYEQYQDRKSESDAKFRAKKARKDHGDGDWTGFSDNEKSGSDGFEEDKGSEVSSDAEDVSGDALLLRASDNNIVESNGLTRRASNFFDQDIFRNIQDLESSAEDNAPIDNNIQTTRITLQRPREGSLPLDAREVRNQSVSSLEADILEDDEHSDFEVVKEAEISEWDRQAEVGDDGRPGKWQ
jgi:AdoMet-dependent rRNA methyltransferase SPB1